MVECRVKDMSNTQQAKLLQFSMCSILFIRSRLISKLIFRKVTMPTLVFPARRGKYSTSRVPAIKPTHICPFQIVCLVSVVCRSQPVSAQCSNSQFDWLQRQQREIEHSKISTLSLYKQLTKFVYCFQGWTCNTGHNYV